MTTHLDKACGMMKKLDTDNISPENIISMIPEVVVFVQQLRSSLPSFVQVYIPNLDPTQS